MAGQYPARTGITTPACHVEKEQLTAGVQKKAPAHRKALACTSATRFSREHHSMAAVLKDAGYKTAHFGKWHLALSRMIP